MDAWSWGFVSGFFSAGVLWLLIRHGRERS